MNGPTDGERATYLVSGVPGSGKSTVAQLLAERFERGVHVRGDVFRRMVVRGREELTPDATPEAWAQLRLRYRLAAAAADAYADAGFTVAVQDVVLGPVLAEYVELLHTRPLRVVVLAPRPEVVAARDAGRGKTGYTRWQLAELDRALREDTPRLGLWLDTSEQTPAETVDAILRSAVPV